MKSINIEILMGHSIGISDSYYRITEDEILEDYLKVLDLLMIDKTRICKRNYIIINIKIKKRHTSSKENCRKEKKRFKSLKQNTKAI